jgi:hypothetical protein
MIGSLHRPARPDEQEDDRWPRRWEELKSAASGPFGADFATLLPWTGN